MDCGKFCEVFGLTFTAFQPGFARVILCPGPGRTPSDQFAASSQFPLAGLVQPLLRSWPEADRLKRESNRPSKVIDWKSLPTMAKIIKLQFRGNNGQNPAIEGRTPARAGSRLGFCHGKYHFACVSLTLLCTAARAFSFSSLGNR